MEESVLPTAPQSLRAQSNLKLNPASTTIASQSRSKVERNNKSCDNCRKRKVRCNANVQNPCAFCLKNKVECQFLSNRKKLGPPSKCYTKSLESRVQLLEKLLDEERKKNQISNHVIQLPPQVSNNSVSLYNDAMLGQPPQGKNFIPDIFLPPQLAPLASSSSVIHLQQQPLIASIENPYLRYRDLIQEIPGLTPELLESMVER